ncbi:MAG: class I SAM-dependent methyltransferase, partial [Bacteroidia bacterium]|nr:class I SAM-dependent methyltransferase [Bacteroidia bacterium]
MMDFLCPVCGNKQKKIFLKTKDFFLSQEDFTLSECTKCSLIITDNFPDENKIGKYYKSENYISHSDNHQKSFFASLYKTARNIMLSRKYTMIKKHHDLTGSLLDVGCGTGYFAGYMKSKGWITKGVEQDEGAAGFAKKNFGLHVITPKEFLNDLHQEPYDVITLWHVLEHLHRLNEN